MTDRDEDWQADLEMLVTLYQAVDRFLWAELNLAGHPPSTSLVLDDRSRAYWRGRSDVITAHDAIAEERQRRRELDDD